MSAECPDTVKSTKKCKESGLRLGSRCDMIWLVWGRNSGPCNYYELRADLVGRFKYRTHGGLPHCRQAVGGRLWV